MIQINYTQKGSILESKKAKRIAILPLSMVNGRPEGRKRSFIWIPNSAIVRIDGFCVYVHDWYLNISVDLREIISENKDLEIIKTIN